MLVRKVGRTEGEFVSSYWHKNYPDVEPSEVLPSANKLLGSLVKKVKEIILATIGRKYLKIFSLVTLKTPQNTKYKVSFSL